MNQPNPDALRIAESARTIALQMLSERGRGAVLVGAARVDAALEVLLKAALVPPSRTETLLAVDRPLGSFGARIALAQRLGLLDASVEQALHTLRKVRNAFAHSTDSASLADPAHAGRLAHAYRAAQANPLWAPLQAVLQQTSGPEGQPVDLALRDYILLITILVAFLEAAAQQLRPQTPAVVMGFGGIQSPRSEPDERA